MTACGTDVLSTSVSYLVRNSTDAKLCVLAVHQVTWALCGT